MIELTTEENLQGADSKLCNQETAFIESDSMRMELIEEKISCLLTLTSRAFEIAKSSTAFESIIPTKQENRQMIFPHKSLNTPPIPDLPSFPIEELSTFHLKESEGGGD